MSPKPKRNETHEALLAALWVTALYALLFWLAVTYL